MDHLDKDRTTVIALLKRHLRGTLDESGRQRLQQWADSSPANQRVLARASDDDLFWQDLAGFDAIPDQSQRIVDYVLARAPHSPDRSPRKTLLTRRVRYAASIAAVLVVGLLTWLFLGDLVSGRWLSQRDGAAGGLAQMEVIAPGGNRAVLLLDGGRELALREDQTGFVVGEALRYMDGTVLTEEDLSATVYTLRTPKGGTYQVTLPDGTKVWLNSASSLRYPPTFADDARVVHLEGEAYFEVNRQSGDLPFLVHTNLQTVEVLGTQFNLSAYADDSQVRTVLVEGVVHVSAIQDGKGSAAGLTLSPGEQSIFDGNAFRKETVDVEQFTSWREGYFMLSGNIPALLQQIGRWYDVEVVYEGDFRDSLDLLVSFPRDRSLDQVLGALQKAKPDLKFRLETLSDLPQKSERRLTIFR